ncbi:hypothetical protein FHY25_002487 [Xanthomonas arboricola]|nr:hypothetical protein [Xanthomonas campestris]MCW2007906.1 hypothetical protein [Xanthomonas campestris]
MRDGLYRERLIARKRAPTERAAFEGAVLPPQTANALVEAHLCAMGFTGMLHRARARSYKGDCARARPMKQREGVGNALPGHYGCAGGAALALAIISATEAVVIGW